MNQTDIAALHHFYSRHISDLPDNHTLTELFAQVQNWLTRRTVVSLDHRTVHVSLVSLKSRCTVYCVRKYVFMLTLLLHICLMVSHLFLPLHRPLLVHLQLLADTHTQRCPLILQRLLLDPSVGAALTFLSTQFLSVYCRVPPPQWDRCYRSERKVMLVVLQYY